MLFVIVGARGAGKSTLLQGLKSQGIEILTPTTTRPPRFDGESEYDFVSDWDDSKYAWRIEVGDRANGGQTYGMRRAEVAKAEHLVCVTVFDPMNLEVFEGVRRRLGTETVTVGLATIADLEEQCRRVDDDPKRRMNAAEFARSTTVVSECDVVLDGDAATLLAAMQTMIALIEGRGGVLTKDRLLPLMQAGALISGAKIANIRPASYDLRIGHEILCQGKVTELSDAHPRFEIPAYSYAVVSAMELASLPPFVIGRFDLKVSYFFEGIILSNGPQIDPGYKGALFCMLYNCSDRPKLLTLGKDFATIDFTTTTSVTEGYRQKYQLQQKMAQFASDSAFTGRGGAIVELVDRKVAKVDNKVKALLRNFWAIAGAGLVVIVAVPAMVVPVLWIEISAMHSETAALKDTQRHEAELLADAERGRRDAALLAAQVRATFSQQRSPPNSQKSADVQRRLLPSVVEGH